MKDGFLLLLCSFLVLAGCNRSPYASSNKSYKKQAKEFARIIRKSPVRDSLSTNKWTGTVNFNLRKPNYVVLHHTAQNSCEQTLKTFTTTKSQVSAHYVICKDGTIHHMLNDYLRAWHGGVSRWGNDTDINSSSIGIELDNNGLEAFSEDQIRSLITLLTSLKKAYNIPDANFIGHQDIAPARKVDPNVYFPWKTLADNGFGIWWSDTTNVNVPPDFNSLHALKMIGYDTRDTVASLQAFKRKFLQLDEGSPLLTENHKKVLYTLFRKLD